MKVWMRVNSKLPAQLGKLLRGVLEGDEALIVV